MLPVDEKKGAGLQPSGALWYLDHLAVICSMMGIPLLFIEDLDYSIGKKFYPNLHAQKVDFHDFTPELLVQSFDVLYMSDLWDRDSFHEKFGPWEKKYDKIMRHVYCPHGFSDKAFHLQHSAREDIALIYGQNMLDMLKQQNVFEELHRYVITGNYRFTYYKNHKKFFDKLMKEEIQSKFDRKVPTLLYAPTWMDSEDSSTFFDANEALIGNLPNKYNLIVKLHPRLELDDAAQFYSIIGKYQAKKNVVILNEFPLVYPILDYVDFYVGDASSVGYDFLTFNRPMFFLTKHKQQEKNFKEPYLFRCGIKISPEQYGDFYKIMEKNVPEDRERFSKIRSEVYSYTFGIERSFKEIKADIIKAYNEDPSWRK
jgi:CDP-Glycerol:Poly(glycerophosphate) glycerophosphotransferase